MKKVIFSLFAVGFLSSVSAFAYPSNKDGMPGGNFDGVPGSRYEGVPGGAFDGVPGGAFDGMPGSSFDDGVVGGR